MLRWGSDMDPCFSCRHDQELIYLEREGVGRVFEGDDGEKRLFWAASLENLLCQFAYMRHRQRSLPYVHEYTSAGKKMSASESVREVVCSAGLVETELGADTDGGSH